MTKSEIIHNKKKKVMLACILFCEFTCSTLYLNISSFFPLFVNKNFGTHINSLMVAISLCAFELSGFVTTPLIPIIINRTGRKWSMVMGFICLLISNTALGALSMFKSH